MTFAAAHVSLWVTVPAAISVACILLWYWLRLGLGDVPCSRRRIRRISLIMAFAALIASVIGVSVVDPATQQTGYVLAWAIVLLMILAIMLSAVLDMFNTMRLQHELRTRMEVDAAVELHRALREKKSCAQTPRSEAISTNGAPKNGTHGTTL